MHKPFRSEENFSNSVVDDADGEWEFSAGTR